MQRSIFLALLAALAPVAAARGQVFTYSFPGGDIPDDSPAGGLSLTGTVPSGGPRVISRLRITLAISGASSSGAYNGDFYAYLKHVPSSGTPGFAVLLNRVGTRAGDTVGYGDNGLSVTFDDAAGGAGDVHVYRQVLNGSHDIALLSPGVLEGIWKTDGRETDPGAVRDTDSRTATLDSFIGLDPSGTWQLYVQDLSGGGAGKVDHWDLEITEPAVVPEPGDYALVLALGLGGFAVWRRRPDWLSR